MGTDARGQDRDFGNLFVTKIDDASGTNSWTYARGGETAEQWRKRLAGGLTLRDAVLTVSGVAELKVKKQPETAKHFKLHSRDFALAEGEQDLRASIRYDLGKGFSIPPYTDAKSIEITSMTGLHRRGDLVYIKSGPMDNQALRGFFPIEKIMGAGEEVPSDEPTEGVEYTYYVKLSDHEGDEVDTIPFEAESIDFHTTQIVIPLAKAGPVELMLHDRHQISVEMGGWPKGHTLIRFQFHTVHSFEAGDTHSKSKTELEIQYTFEMTVHPVADPAPEDVLHSDKANERLKELFSNPSLVDVKKGEERITLSVAEKMCLVTNAN